MDRYTHILFRQNLHNGSPPGPKDNDNNPCHAWKRSEKKCGHDSANGDCQCAKFEDAKKYKINKKYRRYGKPRELTEILNPTSVTNLIT